MENVYSIPTLGGRVKYLREMKGYAQIGVAMKAGITQKALSKIENNETNPSIYRIYRIAESLDVNVHILIPEERWNAMHSTYGIFGGLLIWLLRLFGKKRT